MLNLKCEVCFDSLKSDDNVQVTKCGHLLHYGCMNLWMKRSSTCPQCHVKCRVRSVSRVYFSTSKSGESCESVDVDALTTQLKNDRQRLKLKEQACKKLEEEIKILKKKILDINVTIEPPLHNPPKEENPENDEVRN